MQAFLRLCRGADSVVMRMSRRPASVFLPQALSTLTAAKGQGLHSGCADEITDLSVGDRKHIAAQSQICAVAGSTVRWSATPSCETFSRIVQLFKYLSCIFISF